MFTHHLVQPGIGAESRTAKAWAQDGLYRELRRVAASCGWHRHGLVRLPGRAAGEAIQIVGNLRQADLASVNGRFVSLLGGFRPATAWHDGERQPGLALARHDGSGGSIALLLSDGDEEADRSMIDRLQAGFDLLLVAHRDALAQPAPALLRGREAECLFWAACGKTSAETAIILGLSVHTVNQHLASAQAALGAANRCHAVAIAVSSGLLRLPHRVPQAAQ